MLLVLPSLAVVRKSRSPFPVAVRLECILQGHDIHHHQTQEVGFLEVDKVVYCPWYGDGHREDSLHAVVAREEADQEVPDDGTLVAASRLVDTVARADWQDDEVD